MAVVDPGHHDVSQCQIVDRLAGRAAEDGALDADRRDVLALGHLVEQPRKPGIELQIDRQRIELRPPDVDGPANPGHQRTDVEIEAVQRESALVILVRRVAAQPVDRQVELVSDTTAGSELAGHRIG